MSVYLDHAATTPMLPAAIDAYAEAMRLVGNPASIHTPGQQAKRMLEESRERIAASLGCDPVEVLPFHQMGTSKWERLGIRYPLAGRETPDATTIERVRSRFSELGLPVL